MGTAKKKTATKRRGGLEIKAVKKTAVLTKTKKRHNKKSTTKLSAKKPTTKGKKLNVVREDKKASETIIIKNNAQEKKIIEPSEFRIQRQYKIRMLVPSEPTLIKVSRFSGVFAVIVGGFFTLANLQAIVEHTDNLSGQQSATVIDPTHQTITTTQETVDPKPIPRVSIEGGTTATEMVQIAITVPYANKVDILVKSVETGQIIQLGQAQRIDESTWKFYWNTSQYAHGSYKVKVVITNSYGTYDYQDSAILTIEELEQTTEEPKAPNAPEENVESSEPTDPKIVETSPTTVTETSEVVEEIPAVTLFVPSTNILERSVKLYIKASSATKVVLYAKNAKTLNIHFLGTALKRSDSEWEFIWDTLKLVNGEYKVYANAEIETNSVRSISHTVVVRNALTVIEEGKTDSSTTTTSNVVSDTQTLEPEIILSLPTSGVISSFAKLRAQTSPAKWVELFAVRQSSQTLKFLGLASRQSETEWSFMWDTTQLPNGEYTIYARVRTDLGFFEGKRIPVTIKNEIASELSTEQEAIVEKLSIADAGLTKVVDSIEDTSIQLSNEETPIKVINPVEKFVALQETDEETARVLEEKLQSYRNSLNVLLNELGRAIRQNNTDEISRVKEQMIALKNDLLLRISERSEAKELLNNIDSYISQLTFELEEVTVQNERILRERFGSDLALDSDRDGISDYDEINLYKTNPFVADTDGDGFNDGIEIESGYDPNNNDPEAFIAYESPKESGVLQEELLVVESVTTLSDEESDSTLPKKALISGRGLPNSFVTLYIFSTPIIVTVKTDSDGSWRYIFDKELEEGEHEVYIGVTDNAGKIVGKSEPFRFVKTAEAFTASAEGETVVASTVTDQSLISSKTLLLIASLAVVSLGLVLILLGMHVSNRRPENTLVTP